MTNPFREPNARPSNSSSTRATCSACRSQTPRLTRHLNMVVEYLPQVPGALREVHRQRGGARGCVWHRLLARPSSQLSGVRRKPGSHVTRRLEGAGSELPLGRVDRAVPRKR